MGARAHVAPAGLTPSVSARARLRSGLAWRRVLRPVMTAIVGGAAWWPVEVQAQVTSLATSVPTLSSVAAWHVRGDSGTVGVAANVLTVLINSGAVQNIPALVDNRINAFPAPVSITTQWQLTSIVSLVDLVGYFAAPAAALSTGTSDIPSSRVQGRMVSGRVAGFTAFTQGPVGGSGTPGGTLHLFRQLIIAPVNGQAQRTDNLELQLDLRGLPNLASGTYRGTLNLRAIAY